MKKLSLLALPILALSLLLVSCSRKDSDNSKQSTEHSLLLSLSVFGENEDGSIKTLPAELGILSYDGEQWNHRSIIDEESNVFHKVMGVPDRGLISMGGTEAIVKFWNPNGRRQTWWKADFGGSFSRMRDVEVGDIYGDGLRTYAIATHDQGVVATLRRGESEWILEELDRQENMFVHEIELGDLDGDGVLEVYATPSEPNKMDGTDQYGTVTRYIPAIGEGRYEVADLEGKHAKEILVTDIDGDGKDELYVSIEAVAGGKVEIRRYLADTYPTEGEIIATLDDKLCRFLTVGDVDGDGTLEMVAAANEAGLWVLRPKSGRWTKELIDDQSSSFEHASILEDLDGDGRDELYVASDNQGEFRRYDWSEKGWSHEVLYKYEEGLEPLTWNITIVPNHLIPPADVKISDRETDRTITTASEGREERSPESTENRGLIVNTDEATPGYVLYTAGDDTVFLLNQEGKAVHTWEPKNKPNALYLLENGNLLMNAIEPDAPIFKGGGNSGRIQEYSWDGDLLWDWRYANEDHRLHHDIERLPNGNILAIAWEMQTPDEASKGGRRLDLIGKNGIWPTRIIEVKPIWPDDAEIVWQWHAWDHLIQDFNPNVDNYGDPAAHPELIDINGDNRPLTVDPEELARLKALGYVPDDAQQEDMRSDIFHVNAIDYNEELDQIVLSSAINSEIWIIDHSTTTEEAASHTGGRWGKGGDLLYRWGTAARYGRGEVENQQLGGQHNIQWINKGHPGEGNLIVFNNDKETEDGQAHSAIYEWTPPTHPDGSYIIPEEGPIGPEEPLWKYEAEDKVSFHSRYISGVERLSNGNTFICSGANGRFFEVNPEGKIVWDFMNPYSPPRKDTNWRDRFSAFRASLLEPSHPGLAGRVLEPLDPQPQTAGERVAERKAKEAARGLIVNTDKAAPGFVLYAPFDSHLTYLLNKEGAVVHTWESEYAPGGGLYLLENGNLLLSAREPNPPVFKGGGQAGRIQEISWDGELLWDFKYANEDHLNHHDIEPLPNGNVLAVAWESKTAQEANEVGRRPDLIPKAGVWPTHVIEIEPQRPNGGRIVWEWHLWDHLIQNFDSEKVGFGDPADHPELIDINGDDRPLTIDPEEMARLKAIGYVPDDAQQEDLRSDLFHVNAIDYNEELDQIVLSSNNRKEIWIIDHSTTTEEAAGHSGGRWGKGGDLLYRWGNPGTYDRATANTPAPSNQHDIEWIEKGLPGEGHLLQFVNSAESPEGKYSAIYEIVPPTNSDGSYVIPEQGPIGPEEPIWKYEAADKLSFRSSYVSSSQRLPNGNTFICAGANGRIFEVTSEGKIVWEFWEPFSVEGREEERDAHGVFRATKVHPDHPGLADRILEPLNPQPATVAQRKAKEEAANAAPRGLVFDSDKASPGYTLFSPFATGQTFLMNENEEIVHTWESEYAAGCAYYLLDNGNLLRCAKPQDPLFKAGGEGGRLQMFSWNGELLWDWTHATEDYWLHHDVEYLPNGNILAIAWETKTAQEANQAGRKPEFTPQSGIWPDKIIEIEPIYPNDARIVWEWHSWDHLIQDFDPEKDNYGDPAAHPELLNINAGTKPQEFDAEELVRLRALGYVSADAGEDDIFSQSDTMHTNAIDYNAELDQIVLSSYHYGEIFIIDHSTTTEEAAGHSGGRWGKGGGLLWRWGNPKNYNRGTDEDQRLFNQHDVNWIENGYPDAGKLMVYNNNVPNENGAHSEVYILDVPENADGTYSLNDQGTYAPTEPFWSYRAGDPSSFHSAFISGARRLKNGNTLICEGDDGRYFEVSPEGKIVWEYQEPFSGEFAVTGPGNINFGHATFRVTRIPPDAPALQGRELKPLEPQPQTQAERAGVTAKVHRGLRYKSDEATPGYVMYNPLLSDTTYLLNNDGKVVHLWKSDFTPSGGMYFMEDGSLLRAGRMADLKGFKGGGQGGNIQKLAPDGTVLWEWEYATEEHLSHHDIEPLPNGNLLVLAWESKTSEEANAVGRRIDLIPEAGLWPDHIVEIEPQGSNEATIVWEWHSWDHLIQNIDADLANYGDPSEHPERIDINGASEVAEIDDEELARLKAIGYVPDDAKAEDLESDLFHTNAIAYNAELDQIALSVPNFNEIWIIDHSTTTEEAAGSTGGNSGQGGDLLYRWGNPKMYGQGTDAETKLGFQHNIQWVAPGLPGEGNLIVFNNNVVGTKKPRSAILEWAAPTNADGSYAKPDSGGFGPTEPDWKYEDPGTLFGPFISGVQRLPNGHTLICEGPSGRMFEVTSDGEIVWEYWDPFSGSVVMPDGTQPQPVDDFIHAIFRATKIPTDHPGLKKLKLEPLDPQPLVVGAEVAAAE